MDKRYEVLYFDTNLGSDVSTLYTGSFIRALKEMRRLGKIWQCVTLIRRR